MSWKYIGESAELGFVSRKKNAGTELEFANNKIELKGILLCAGLLKAFRLGFPVLPISFSSATQGYK